MISFSLTRTLGKETFNVSVLQMEGSGLSVPMGYMEMVWECRGNSYGVACFRGWSFPQFQREKQGEGLELSLFLSFPCLAFPSEGMLSDGNRHGTGHISANTRFSLLRGQLCSPCLWSSLFYFLFSLSLLLTGTSTHLTSHVECSRGKTGVNIK